MEAMGDREEKQSVSEQIETKTEEKQTWKAPGEGDFCLLYTSDAADEL